MMKRLRKLPRATDWVAVFGLTFAVRLVFLAQPLPALIGSSIYDDAFYYLVTAGRIASTGVPSFDGRNVTNGFHPLWMTVNVAVVSVIGSGERALYALLVIETLLDGCTALLIYLTLSRLTCSRSVALILALLYALNRKIVLMQLNSMESALVGCTVALVLYLVVRTDALRRTSGWGAAGLGFACGLAFLSRTDSGILVALVCAVCLPTFGVEIEDGRPLAPGRSPLGRCW